MSKDKTKPLMTRREALGAMATGIGAAIIHAGEPQRRFLTCGVVLYPWDLSLADWPERAHKAGITAIGLHAARRLDVLVDFVKSDQGRHFLHACQRLGINIEYEVHALGTFLSREYFAGPDKDMFRMDSTGQRNPDYNCCPSSQRALDIIAEKAVEYGGLLKPTTNRYFFWPDDAREWCSCPKCKGLTSSDQSTLVENTMAIALQKHVRSGAAVSHIAYGPTLNPPGNVPPHKDLFLEFAPIARVYDHPIDDPDVQLGGAAPEPESQAGYLDILDANLAVFPCETAQVLEYWLDVSRYSGWKQPVVKLPWLADVVRADGRAYARRGIRHVTTFATWIDADYVKQFGHPPLKEYVNALNG